MNVRKGIYLVIGSIALGLGALGAIMPVLPTFPFLLLATCCFAKSSDKLHQWVVGTKLYQNNLESYVQGKGMTKKAKIRVMTIVSLLMAIGFLMMHRVWIGQLVLAGVWAFHMIYFIFGIKTIPESNEEMYPWSVQLMIEGMHCEHCAKRLESAFQKQGKMKAEVNFKNKIATIYAQEMIENEVIHQIVQQAGYAIAQMS